MKRILIVDDSLTVRKDLCEIFESASFETTACNSLSAARQALSQEAFALVVLDVVLPDGDGLDLLRSIRDNPATAAIPVMLLSTEAEVRDRVRGLKTGADDYVGKPYDGMYVLARAQGLIGSGEPQSERTAPTLLIVDDSATFREEFRTLLAGAGYSVAAAASGEEALRMAFALRPDAMVVDHLLGGGIDGCTVIRRLKQDLTLRTTPCLLLTASTEACEELRALEAGADAYLRKETDPNVILARISALLRSDSTAPALERHASSLLGDKKVLVVDDSATYVYELSAQLRQEGYDVIPAYSGKEGLELLEAQPVDCILLDVRMPGLSGHQVCQLVKKRPEWRAIPLVMLTAAEEPEAVIEGINAGADDYIPKSSDFDVLKARVRAQLRRKQFEDEYRTIREELLKKELEAAEARAAQKVAETRAALVDELEQKNRELEAFSYSVSHDLRAPLRSILGFSQALVDEFADQLPRQAASHLGRVRAAGLRMAELIDALLELSSISRLKLNRKPIDLTNLARALGHELAQAAPERRVEFSVEDGLTAEADAVLLRVVLNNLLGNAWKFTGKTAQPRVEAGMIQRGGQAVYFVRDNGVGFDQAHAPRLFEPFERMHPAGEFPGTGIGLATVRRIIDRHGGEVWAESAVGQGATFFFTLGSKGNGSVEMARRVL